MYHHFLSPHFTYSVQLMARKRKEKKNKVIKLVRLSKADGSEAIHQYWIQLHAKRRKERALKRRAASPERHEV